MSVIGVDDRLVMRIYPEGEPLPTIWDEFRVLRPTDVDVVRFTEERDSGTLPLQHETLQGVGWIMLENTVESVYDTNTPRQ